MKKIFLKRVIGSEILSAANEFPVVILTGPRQTGKSTLLKMLFPNYTYITMDDPFARKTAVEDPILFLENAGEKMLIDEVQYIRESFLTSRYLWIKSGIKMEGSY